MWIVKLTAKNYRAFQEKIEFTIEYGTPLLIYGENGSGKSSLFKAIKEIFEEDTAQLQAIFPKNKFVDEQEVGFVKAEIESIGESSERIEIVYSSNEAISTDGRSLIERSKYQSGFLDYKSLLRVHGIESAPHEAPNLFEFLTESLLANHSIPSFDSSGNTTISQELTLLKSASAPGQRISRAIRERFKFWLTNVREQLQAITQKSNEWIKKYFSQNLSINFEAPDPLGSNIGEIRNLKISLLPSYGNEKIPNYHDFINEARLSAVSICLFLSSLAIRPISRDNLSVLYLDDIFIGLDTNNRRPLLRLLYEEFICQTNDHRFQLILSTYDKSWFQFANSFLVANNLQPTLLELYATKSEADDHPDIMMWKSNPSKDLLSDAKIHFNKLNYSLSAHMVRKVFEQEFKRILPASYLETGGSKITKLATLIQQFQKFKTEFNLEVPEVKDNELSLFLQTLMNPSSHDDNESPVYMREVHDLILLAEALRTVPQYRKELVLSYTQTFRIISEKHGFSLEFSPSKPVSKLLRNGHAIGMQPKPKFLIKYWELSGTPWGNMAKNGEMEGKVTSMSKDKRDTYLRTDKEIIELVNAAKMNGVEYTMGEFLDNCLDSNGISLSSILNHSPLGLSPNTVSD